jgi:hypothetical protein
VPLPNVVAHDMMSSTLSSLRRPVVVTIAYMVDREDTDNFRDAMMDVAAARRRNGATSWVLGRDVGQPERWLEAFRLPDWLELHRGIARVNLTDAAAAQAARAFHNGERPPDVAIMVIEQG